MICFHKWGKWSELVSAYSGVFQYRICEKCGKVEKKRRGCNNDFNLAIWNKNKQENQND